MTDCITADTASCHGAGADGGAGRAGGRPGVWAQHALGQRGDLLAARALAARAARRPRAALRVRAAARWCGAAHIKGFEGLQV